MNSTRPTSSRAALIGWAAVAATVVVYDTWAVRSQSPTLSKCFRDGVQHPVLRWVVVPFWLGLTWHLLTGWPSPNKVTAS